VHEKHKEILKVVAPHLFEEPPEEEPTNSKEKEKEAKKKRGRKRRDAEKVILTQTPALALNPPPTLAPTLTWLLTMTRRENWKLLEPSLLTNSLAYELTNLLTYSLLTHSLTHSLTYLLT